VALDAEVVVGACGEFAASGTALQQSLRKGDRGRNAVLLAMANCDALVFVDIFKKHARKPLRRRGEAHQRKKNTANPSFGVAVWKIINIFAMKISL